jgi:mevalonate kinase
MSHSIFTASAPGKIILMGEHAVVYGRPAMAAPVHQVQATATLTVDDDAAELWIDAADVNQRFTLSAAPTAHPLALALRLAVTAVQRPAPGGELRVRSTIPVAGGMGSGAAVSTAIVRAVAAWAGLALPPAAVSALAYEVERLHHGTPSGIDNTVIAYAQPVWFVKGQPPQPFAIPHPFWLVIASTGIASPTHETVGDVRRGWQADPALFEGLFEQVAGLVNAGRAAMLAGDWSSLGARMTANHAILRQMGVSAPILDRLVAAANAAGAYGAKLSGGGRGGNVIALVERSTAAAVGQAMHGAGATAVIITPIGVNT